MYDFPAYIPVSERRAKAKKLAEKLTRQGNQVSPILIEGRNIATTFWGKAWCKHLESYSDYENRLPRGRSYARHGSIIDLKISAGKVEALVSGSSLYNITVSIQQLSPEKWEAIQQKCAGKIDSLIDLLQGKLSDSVMAIMTDRDEGLFPGPQEINLNCDCPDWADLCKHLAAVLYGIGARLDTQPELLFTLRGVDHIDLLNSATEEAPILKEGEEATLNSDDLSDIFGIEIAKESPPAPPPNSTEGATQTESESESKPVKKKKTVRKKKTKTVRKIGLKKTRLRVKKTPVKKSKSKAKGDE